jgi:hypothetical protein
VRAKREPVSVGLAASLGRGGSLACARLSARSLACRPLRSRARRSFGSRRGARVKGGLDARVSRGQRVQHLPHVMPPPPPPQWDAQALGVQNAGYVPTAPGLAPGMRGYIPPAAAPPPPGMFKASADPARSGASRTPPHFRRTHSSRGGGPGLLGGMRAPQRGLPRARRRLRGPYAHCAR